MLALVLLAVGTVSAAELFQRAQMGSVDGEHTLIATRLAQRRLEELRNLAYANLASEVKATITTPSGFSRFSREVVVTTPQPNLKQVVVRVLWSGTGGETHVALQTYRAAN